jgi:hypothetical protein
MAKNLAWCFVERIYVGVHTIQPPSQEEWDAMLKDLSAHQATLAVVHTEGGSPSAFQRKQLRDISEQIGLTRSVVLTSSAVARAVVTTFNLFSKGFASAFSPKQIDNALTYLEIAPNQWPAIKKEIVSRKRELSILGA